VERPVCRAPAALAAVRTARAFALSLAVGLLAAALGPVLAVAQTPQAGGPVTIDGPTPDIAALNAVSIARDGTGGIVYLKNVLGVRHAFVSRLVGGVFRRPEQLDAGLPGASSQPVIAAGNGGVVLAGFINAGELYVVDRPSASSPATGPIPLAAAASNPSISMSNFGKAYLSFTTSGAGGHDVRAAFYENGAWGLEPSPLDADPNDDAGVGTGRSDVTTAGDGVGIVAWGEAGHVFTRRLRGTSASVVFEQADVPNLNGWNAIAADQPSIGAGGDSSYATVAFHETLGSGVQQQSRVFMRRLHGSQFDGLAGPDGLQTPGTSGAIQPNTAVTEYGRGFVTSARDDTNQVFAMTLGSNDAPGPVAQVDSLPNSTAPDAVPALAGLFTTLIAWQHDPGGGGAPEIRLRYSPSGNGLGPELVLSDPSLGGTDADRGLVAGGDTNGNALAAWIQGSGSNTRIATRLLYVAPGSFAPSAALQYVRRRQPVLSWSAARDQWGPLEYSLTLDGATIAQTPATALRVPVALADGPHTWSVTASNPAGLTRTSSEATEWVDTVAPVIKLALTGTKQVGLRLRAHVTYTDAPPPEPRRAASGVVAVEIRWGDGSRFHIAHYSQHAFKRSGRYKLTVIVRDAAGNRSTLTKTIQIKRKPKPKPKRKTKSSGTGTHR
jgi:hypothetical protein